MKLTTTVALLLLVFGSSCDRSSDRSGTPVVDSPKVGPTAESPSSIAGAESPTLDSLSKQNSLVPKDAVGRLLDSLDTEWQLSREESRHILEFAGQSWSVKRDLVRRGLAEEHAHAFQIHAACLSKVVIGLDPDSSKSEALLDELLAAFIRDPNTPPVSLTAAFELVLYLHIPDSTRASLFLDWLNDDSNILPIIDPEVVKCYAHNLDSERASVMAMLLGRRLVAHPKKNNTAFHAIEVLAQKLSQDDVTKLTTMLLGRLKQDVDSDSFRSLQLAIKPLLSELTLESARPLSKSLIPLIRDEQDVTVLSELMELFVELAPDPSDLTAIAELLVKRLDKESGHKLYTLVGAITDVADKLEHDQIKPIVAGITRRLSTERNLGNRSTLANSLVPLVGKLDPDKAWAVVDLVVQEVFKQDGWGLDKLIDSLPEAVPHLRPTHRLQLVSSVVENISMDQDWRKVSRLSRLTRRLIGDSDVRSFRPEALALVKKVLTPNLDASSLPDLTALCETLELLASNLSSDELLPVVSKLAKQIQTADRAFQRGRLTRALAPLVKHLSAEHSKSLATSLIARMSDTKDTQTLISHGSLVAAMAENLPASAVQTAIKALTNRIHAEPMLSTLEELAKVFIRFEKHMDARAARTFVKKLTPRLREERDEQELALFAQLIHALSDKLEPTEIDGVRQMLIVRLEEMRDAEALVILAEVIAKLPGNPDPAQRAALAEKLLASLAQAYYPELATYSSKLAELPRNPDPTQLALAEKSLALLVRSYDPESPKYLAKDELKGLRSLIAHANLQSLVDAFRSPMLVDGLVANTIFRAIEEKVGKSFDSDLWKFVEWVTNDPRGQELKLDLTGTGPWAVLEESKPVEFPPLERVELKQQGSIELKGAVWAFCIEGETVFLPGGIHGLGLVDISTPSRPREVGRAPAGPHAIAVCVNRNHAYVTTGPAGMPESYLRVVDISDLKAPKVVGSLPLPDYPTGVATRGDLVFVADHTEGLRIIDVSDPKSPKEVGSYETPGFIRNVCLVGDLALLADQEVGLRVVDVSQPQSPRQLALVRTKGPCLDVCVEADRAYLATGDSGVVVLDISTPASPKEVATIPVQISTHVSVSKNLLAVSSARLGVQVFDVSEPASPKATTVKMRDNAGAVRLQSTRLFATDVALDPGLYGSGQKTVLRIYKIHR